MKTFLAILCVIGVLGPFYFVFPFFMEHGLNLELFIELLWANRVSQFFAIDLVISSIAFIVWSYQDARKLKLKYWWAVLISNLCVGLSLALPLYLWMRHKPEMKTH